ncbi:MAG: LacI family DNA-binding transcriptional regulator [Lentisphaerae bacterium]|nr:LacI family DNA-binding transcriptional regulator [Lentisphaerota bacterium]
MSTNLKQIAGKAGVSIAAASLALRDSPRIAPATRDRIHRLAEEMGYVPSNLGRALQARRSRLVGYLVSDVTASFYSDVLQGVGEVATDSDYSIITALADRSAEAEQRHLRVFREKRVDGILVSNISAASHDALRRIEAAGVPIVMCSSSTFDERIPFVVIDNQEGGAMAVEHLSDLGHHRLAYAFGGDSPEARFAGAAAAARRRGLPPLELCADAAALSALVRSSSPPTGVVAFSDFAAIEVKHTAEAAGLRVPEDVSVVGFDDLWFAGLKEFSLTTVAQPKREIGRYSMELLLDRIEGRPAEGRCIQPSLIVRGSTRPPRSMS